MKERNRIEKR